MHPIPEEDSGMARKVIETFEVGGFKVEIGPAMSKDGGLVVVARNIRGSAWFPALVDVVLAALSSTPHKAHGFKVRAKLEAGLLALIAGLVMGRRNPNAIAESLALDPLWKLVVGRSFTQRELSRLMEVVARVGEPGLRRALLGSALEGWEDLELDMDSSVLELHGTQEWGGYNAHYHTFGYHAGWALDTRSGKIAALWLNEGNANTARGQADQLTWILNQGTPVSMVRFDAGLINPEMLQAMDGRVDRFACRIRPNQALERLANPIEPPGPYPEGSRSYGEIRYAADTWAKDQRVVVKFQAPEGTKGSLALFPERFYFVTSLRWSASTCSAGKRKGCSGSSPRPCAPPSATWRSPRTGPGPSWWPWLTTFSPTCAISCPRPRSQPRSGWNTTRPSRRIPWCSASIESWTVSLRKFDRSWRGCGIWRSGSQSS